MQKKYDVCVFGGCALDTTYLQKEDGTYDNKPDKIVPGGKGSNQAVAASRAGAIVTIISRVGKDDVGQEILDNLQYNSVFTNNVEVVSGLNNDLTKIYVEKENKDNDIVRINGAVDSFTPDMVSKYKSVLLNSKLVVAQMKIPKGVSIELINFCYDNNIPIIVTPCRPQKLSITEPGNLELIDKITYITANRKECQIIFGTDDIEACVRKYPNKLIVTLGEDGVMYCDGNEIKHYKALKIDNIADTTGAGDTFNGNLAYCLTHGYSLDDAIIRSQYASSMKLQQATAQAGMPYKEQLDEYIKLQNADKFDYYSEFDLAYSKILEAYEAIKNKISLKISRKEDKTFVTESDLLIEQMLIDAIKKMFPNDNFLTEETNSKNSITDRTWVIDPIDGTIHYMKGSIFYGIQLAFIDKNEVKFSIVYIPSLNEMYYAVKDHGTYLNNKRIILSTDGSVEQSIVEFCGSLNKFYDDKRRLLEKIMLEQKRVTNFIHINSCSFAFANLISQRTNALVLSTKKNWDILPGIMLCQEAGVQKVQIVELSIYSSNPELIKALVNEDNIGSKGYKNL